MPSFLKKENKASQQPFQEPAASDPPPPYSVSTAQGESSSRQPAIDVTAAFARLTVTNAVQDPTPDLCLAHLKLLHAFHDLKEDIGYTDGLFGLWNSRADDAILHVRGTGILEERGSPSPTDEDKKFFLSKLREKRWALFVARAVDRYEIWWNATFKLDLTMEDQTIPSDPRYDAFPTTDLDEKRPGWMMMPLDVLMVFHSHMLNPRAFLEDCMRYQARTLWRNGIPWGEVNEAIDANFNYDVPDDGKAAWVAHTGCAWNNTDDPIVKERECPSCKKNVEIPWTTCNTEESAKAPEYVFSPKFIRVGISCSAFSLDRLGPPLLKYLCRRPGLIGNGYGDGNFSFKCPLCADIITNDFLCVSKFTKDCTNLIRKKFPLPGTVLHLGNGTPELLPTDNRANKDARTFPNRMIERSFLRTGVMDLDWPAVHPMPSMHEARKLIEEVLASNYAVKRINGIPWELANKITSIRLKAAPRLAVRKMMSRYWDNRSCFALDLSGAVLRQGIFVDKMVDINWLHSPAAPDTMARLLAKYRRFFHIMATHPGDVAVPTLDVDLAWHTHQLCPGAYYRYSLEATGKFIDHNDKIDESKLSTAFEWTSKIYQETYDEVYSECTCWYCESIRASHISSVGKLLGTSKQDKISDKFHDSGTANYCPPDKSAHISAHNAVKTNLVGVDVKNSKYRVFEQMRAAHQRRLDESYAKACRRAEKKGRKMPPKEGYYSNWGYSYAASMPFFYPMYFTPVMYGGGDPCHIDMGQGQAGTCCEGSCGANGVAAGACGGPGGCGSMGGCGGSNLGASCLGGGGKSGSPRRRTKAMTDRSQLVEAAAAAAAEGVRPELVVPEWEHAEAEGEEGAEAVEEGVEEEAEVVVEEEVAKQARR